MTDAVRSDSVQSDEVFIGGPERRDVVLVDHDPAWAGRFAAERRKIETALGDAAFRVEHIGSTAVPGLVAKAIVDILVTVADADAEPGYLPALEGAGYVLRVREPGHRMVRTPQLDVHVHVLAEQNPAAAAYLTFRDRLRSDPTDRARYAATKRQLASRDWPTVNHYAKAKTDVIAEILARAAAERAAR